MTMRWTVWFLLIVVCFTTAHAGEKLKEQIDLSADRIESKVIEWRRQFHQFPELSNREFKTAQKVAEHLTHLGLEVRTGIAHTGVVGLLKGSRPGPVVALRADMDALPVTERVDVLFASKVRAEYNGQDVGVMHACGHDAHTAILMGVAEILSSMKKDLKGSVKFIFQPAEEGAPQGEEGGADLMVAEGVLENPKVEVIFGLHVWALKEVGMIGYRPESMMAASDGLRITVKGKQTHGSTPWTGVDPITVSAQIIMGLQTIISRQTELTEDAAVITIGSIHGGVRSNIIPDQVEMIGTIRTLNTEMQDKIHERIRWTVTKIAESAGAVAEVRINKGNPVTYNDPDLTAMMLPSLEAAAGAENVTLIKAITGAEDFSFFQRQIPGLYFFIGAMPKGTKPEEAAPHHSPDFYIDESCLKLGVRSLSYLVLDYMDSRTESSDIAEIRREEVRRIMNDYYKLGPDSEIQRDFEIRGPLTVAQFEEELLEWKRRVQKLSKKPDEDIYFDVPEGFEKLKEGEEIYHFRSDDRSWAHLAGLDGYVKIRKNKVIDSFIIVLS